MNYSTNTVCHMFANNKTNPRNRFFWENCAENYGCTIFYTKDQDNNRFLWSYGRHFCIAKITTAEDFTPVCFFTTRYYSSTTAKHIAEARRAIWQKLIFCAYPDAAPRLNFEDWESKIKESEKNMVFATKPAKYADEIRQYLHQVSEYAAAAGVRRPSWFNKYERIADEMKPRQEARKRATKERKQRAAERKRREEWRKEEIKREEAREAARRATLPERLAAWEAGENIYLSWEDTAENVPLRIATKKNYTIIETGKGIQLTTTQAGEFWRMYQRGEIKKGNEIAAGGFSYTVREVTPEYIQIGCHRFAVDYLKRFAEDHAEVVIF